MTSSEEGENLPSFLLAFLPSFLLAFLSSFLLSPQGLPGIIFFLWFPLQSFSPKCFPPQSEYFNV
jgi:hypothetical protein